MCRWQLLKFILLLTAHHVNKQVFYSPLVRCIMIQEIAARDIIEIWKQFESTLFSFKIIISDLYETNR